MTTLLKQNMVGYQCRNVLDYTRKPRISEYIEQQLHFFKGRWMKTFKPDKCICACQKSDTLSIVVLLLDILMSMLTIRRGWLLKLVHYLDDQKRA